MGQLDDSTGFHSVQINYRKELGNGYFELALSRPENFQYDVGQRIRFVTGTLQRDYSLISTPDMPYLSIFFRSVPHGRLTPKLMSAQVGDQFNITGPHGYFRFQSSQRMAVFVATGTGIAPFVAFARSGISGYILLYGVRDDDDLFYLESFENQAALFVPCVSGKRPGQGMMSRRFDGTVSEYLSHELSEGSYDFYVCGNRRMIRDVTHIIDHRFSESRLFYEIFY